jgi:uncharacterized protein YjbI with pentapeptide repeats
MAENSQRIVNEKEERDFVCPITQEPIVYGGMTVTYSLYEFDAISKWLETNDTDPLTNLLLPNKHIWRISSLSKQQISKVKNNMSIVFSTIAWSHSEQAQARERQLLLDIKHSALQSTEWTRYSQELRRLMNDKTQIELSGYTAVINNNEKEFPTPDLIEQQRPDNTGCHFMYAPLENLVVRNKHFKCTRFDGANMQNSLFFQCDFSRCTFMLANLRQCVFVRCKFYGEQVLFNSAVIDHQTKFFDCDVEMADRWTSCVSLQETIKSFQTRGLNHISAVHFSKPTLHELCLNQTFMHHLFTI